MKIIVKKRWRWCSEYGATHTGARWFLFGALPVWRVKRPVDRSRGEQGL